MSLFELNYGLNIIEKKKAKLEEAKKEILQTYAAENAKFELREEVSYEGNKQWVQDIEMTSNGEFWYTLSLEISPIHEKQISKIKPKRWEVSDGFSGSLEVRNAIGKDNNSATRHYENAIIKFRDDRIRFPVTIVFQNGEGDWCTDRYVEVTFELPKKTASFSHIDNIKEVSND